MIGHMIYLHYGGGTTLREKRKKQASSLVAEYRHERKMALQRKRRLEKKGFVFPDGVIPDIPKKITAGSVRRLKKLTPKKLQEMGTLKTEEGKSLTGASARLKYQQKYKAQRKATRKKRKKQKGIELRKIARETAKEFGFPTTEKVIKTIETEEDLKTYLMDIEEFLANKERAKEENVNDGFEELEEEPEDYGWFSDDFYPAESDLVYEEIIRILNDGFNRDACQVALDALNEKIQKVGFNQTMQIINAASDDLLEAANVIAYSSDQEEVESSLSAFITVINGEPLTAEQAQEVSKKLNSKRFENYYNTTYF